MSNVMISQSAEHRTWCLGARLGGVRNGLGGSSRRGDVLHARAIHPHVHLAPHDVDRLRGAGHVVKPAQLGGAAWTNQFALGPASLRGTIIKLCHHLSLQTPLIL